MKKIIVTCVACLVMLATLALVQTAAANPLGGPISGIDRALAHGVTVHKVTYIGGEQADFRIKGDGDTSLNIVVKDQNGFEVVRTTGRGDDARVTWTPAQTSVFYIFVVNEGGVYNQYRWNAY